MTLEELKALVKSPRWQWLPGMLALRVAPGMRDHLRAEIRVSSHGWPMDCLVPSMDDAPTRGAVLGLVRDLFTDPHLTTFYHPGKKVWSIRSGEGNLLAGEHPTESAALAAAILLEDSHEREG